MTIPVAVLPRSARRGLPTEHAPRVVVATDGREQSDAALRGARALLAGGPLGVVTVLDPLHSEDASESRESMAVLDTVARQALVEAQLKRVLGDDVDSWIDVRRGDAPAMLAESAVARGALLIVGIGRPRVLDRLRGDESALRVVREARTPVLTIASGSQIPPRRIVLAMDFSDGSIAAAHLALGLAARRAEVTLAHVAPSDHASAWGTRALGYRGDPESAVERCLAQFALRYDVRISPSVLVGDVANELLDIAARQRADLIALGAHGHGPGSRITIGAVTTRVVRCATCSVLVAPRSVAHAPSPSRSAGRIPC